MSLKASLPGVRDPIVGQGGVASRPIYTFFQAIATTVDALSASGNVTIPDLPISENANVVGASGFSIYTQGTLKTGIVRILLDGDTQTPGNTQYYGSGPAGTRGWFSVSDALDSTDNITLTVGADGVTTFDLADLANSGTGAALVKITRDSKGRIAGTSAATTSDLAEGSNLYYTDARASAAAPVQSVNGQTGAVTVAAVMPAGYIDGLKPVWVSGTALTVTSGAAYIESTGAVLAAPSDIAKTGLSLSASTWYHIYLYDNAGTPDIELSTTAPASPYSGTARSKAGDSSRRYVGSVLTSGSGGIYAFRQIGCQVMYLANIFGAPFLVAQNLASTTPANISCAGVIPATSRLGLLTAINSDPAVAVVLGTSDQGYTLTSGAFNAFVNPNSSVLGPFLLDGSQVIQYMYRSAPTGTFAIRVSGYVFER